MTDRARIRVLEPRDAESCLALRREALHADPLAFAASPEDDVSSTVEAVRASLSRAPGFVIFGAFEEELVGSVGVQQDARLKSAHRCHERQ